MFDLETANKINIKTTGKMWDGTWVKSSKTTRFGETLWVREDRPESHPLTTNNIQNGIKSGFEITLV